MQLLSVHHHTRHGPELIHSKPVWRPRLWLIVAVILLSGPLWISIVVMLRWAAEALLLERALGV